MKIFYFVITLLCVLLHSSNINAQQKTVSSEIEQIIFQTTTSVQKNVTDFSTPLYFPLQNPVRKNSVPCLIEGANGKLIFVWSEKFGAADSVFAAVSNDGGLNWENKKFIHNINSNLNTTLNLTGIKTATGRILVIFSNHASVSSVMRTFHSDDNGNSWSAVENIGTGTSYNGKFPVLSKGNDGKIWLTYSASNNVVSLRYSEDNGNSWSSPTVYPETDGGDTYTHIIPFENNLLKFFSVSGKHIISRTTTDNGNTWTEPVQINTLDQDVTKASVRRSPDGTIWLVYQSTRKSDYFDRYQEEIFYTNSTDNGVNWTVPTPFTNYVDFDGYPVLSFTNNQPIVGFTSIRYDTKHQLWLGKPGITQDILAPPILVDFIHGEVLRNKPVQFNVSIDSYIDIPIVKLNYSVNSIPQNPVLLFDDGLHGDGEAGDHKWGNTAGPFLYNDTVKYFITATDFAGNSIASNEKSFVVPQTDYYIFDINYVWMPVSPDGVIGDAGNNWGGKYEDIVFLFSGGFFLSGVTNGNLWGNGVLSASRIVDFQPGIVGSNPGQAENIIYVVNNSDPHFGESWQKWRDAVALGADFYDGDGDGIYNPVDKNGNGIWDPDEDRPDLIGNVTAWSVLNDGVPAEQRRFGVEPQEVEIHQTFFAFGNTEHSLANTFFIRYRILNKSQNDWDSLYFSVAVDADLGDYTDDITGSDTITNSGYYYNYGPDSQYGTNPPAFFTTILQGPKIYIPGETFIDVNGNGSYDEGIDIPVDTASNVRGPQLGIDLYPGAKNLGMSSFTQYIKSHPTFGDPNTHYELRNYIIGGVNKYGTPLNPCDWPYGYVNGVNCNEVNPKFMYSGDPETDIGWINNLPNDVRGMTNTGPFNLKSGESIDIVAAYIIGRGSSATNSVTVVRNMVFEVQNIFNQNYPVVVGTEQTPNIVSDYKLNQNYPNPFNPTTVISYQLPVEEMVTLKVFDFLGREVTTLINEYKSAGNYQLEFDASKLSSGIYFYRLRAGNFTETKKMMVIK